MRPAVILTTIIVACFADASSAIAWQIADLDEAAMLDIAKKMRNGAGSRTVDEPRPGQTVPEVPDSYREHEFQQGPNCGPNSVFICLKLLGFSVNYSDVKPRFNITGSGTTMDELVRVAASFGLSLQPLKGVTVSDLAGMRGPVVVHLDTPASARDPAQTDHFTVLLKYDPAREVFRAIDSSSCANVELSGKHIARSFSGHCLVPASATSRVIRGAMIVILGALAILVAWWMSLEVRIFQLRAKP